ncbi:mRNA surveillance protein pelota [Candidatus Nanosalina sp. VS9-1]|uniref:mRNA surveillance protein pelota n=1 Tax=Candidatus Nanosalina sp. VS9-1 TaxID=3388566 RepID=UPI0039E0BF0D
MEILKSDRSDGYVRIEIENEDDLWYLKDIIGEGDTVKAFTQRTKRDSREKKATHLTLRTEKVEYQENRLRVTGEITRGDEDVEMGYHTFNLEPGKEFEIWKDFSEEEWERLEEAESHHSYRVLFVLVQKGEADFYIVEESGIKNLSKIDLNIPGKLYSDQIDSGNFHNQVKEVIKRSSRNVDHIVLCGPGFEKNKIKNMLDEEIISKTLMQDTSVIGRTGLNEAIKRGALDKVVESSRISDESRTIEELMEALREDDKVSYGAPVNDLVNQGAVEKLILTAEKYREEHELAKKVEEMGGEVEIVHIDHEAGKRLENLGGKAAILRYQPH